MLIVDEMTQMRGHAFDAETAGDAATKLESAPGHESAVAASKAWHPEMPVRGGFGEEDGGAGDFAGGSSWRSGRGSLWGCWGRMGRERARC